MDPAKIDKTTWCDFVTYLKQSSLAFADLSASFYYQKINVRFTKIAKGILQSVFSMFV